MKTLFNFLVLLLLCGFTIPAKAQYEINSSIWMDEYTVQHHINQYLSNLVLSYDYYQKWNTETQQFESALPARLTYTPFASENIKVEAFELDYTQRYKLFKWESFSQILLDSLMKNSKNMYTTLLRYDAQGRITNSVYRDFQYKPMGQRIDYSITYNHPDTVPGFTIEVSWSEGLILHKRSTSVISYAFNEKQQLVQANVSHQSARENSTFENTYNYDSFGRLTRFKQVPSSEVYIDRNYEYTITPFLLDSAQNNYKMLRTPSVQHWLRSYDDNNLNIISYQKFERNRNAFVEYSYLVDSEQNRLLMLRPYPSYFGEILDSNSITRSKCGISRSQDLNDTIPYDPNYKPRYIGTFYSQCSVEERYTKPPGLVNAGSVEGYKCSEHVLPNGWKRITYQRGSSAPSRFAPGYVASVRLDIRYDKHLILDSGGVVRYIIDYDKMMKITVEKR